MVFVSMLTFSGPHVRKLLYSQPKLFKFFPRLYNSLEKSKHMREYCTVSDMMELEQHLRYYSEAADRLRIVMPKIWQ